MKKFLVILAFLVSTCSFAAFQANEIHETHIAGFPAFEIYPEGTPKGTIVFLHGSFGDHRAFRSYMEAFSHAGYSGIAFSRRGRGELGPTNCEGVTLDDYLADVRTVLEAIKTPVILVGHSLGGLLAQHMAVEGRCKAAVLLASAPPGMLTPQLRSLPSLIPSFPRILAGFSFRPSDEVIGRIALGNLTPEEKGRVLSTLGPESGKVYRSLVLGIAGPESYEHRCPILVMGGSNDWIISVSMIISTARAYYGELKIFPGMGHWMIEEKGWEEVVAFIVQWFEEGRSSYRSGSD